MTQLASVGIPTFQPQPPATLNSDVNAACWTRHRRIAEDCELDFEYLGPQEGQIKAVEACGLLQCAWKKCPFLVTVFWCPHIPCQNSSNIEFPMSLSSVFVFWCFEALRYWILDLLGQARRDRADEERWNELQRPFQAALLDPTKVGSCVQSVGWCWMVYAQRPSSYPFYVAGTN